MKKLILVLVCLLNFGKSTVKKPNIYTNFFKLFLVSFIVVSDVSQCGDWEQYKDEHCYKLFDGLKTYVDAKILCQTNNSSLVSIHYAEEQNFLSNYIFTKKKAVDNIWIGAKYVGNKFYEWEDGSTLTGSYNNWAPGNPRNMTDHCVEMLSLEGSEGKWADERCAKSNLVVCQRMPLPSIQKLAEAFIELKHTLVETKNELVETNKKVAQLEKETVPIGFIYVQLPKEKAPSELWPRMVWNDISSEYAGVFFRVLGGHSANFGELQEANAPRLETVHSSKYGVNIIGKQNELSPINMSIPVTGWSDAIFTGSDIDKDFYCMNFKHSDIAEVRPKNMAIKVYRRTA